MANIFTFDTLNLDSSEITNIKISRNKQVNINETLSLYEITQSGVLKAYRISVDTVLRKNAYLRFDEWINKFGQKPVEQLTMLSRIWGDYHFESIDFDIDSVDDVGQIIELKMTLQFIQNIDFTNL
jgi:hypothetical protein